MRAAGISGVDLKGMLFDELRTQCQFILSAASDIRRLVHDEVHSSEKVERVWFTVQMLLISAANASKLLEAIELSRVASDESIRPLRDRKFRNHFEHYDERLRNWWASHGVSGAPFIDRCFTSGQKEISQSAACLRNLDTKNWIITFKGEEFSIAAVEEAARRVCEWNG